MAVDARFDKITKIERHPNADTLDIATVSNFPCIVKRGEFSVGNWVFYKETCQEKSTIFSS